MRSNIRKFFLITSVEKKLFVEALLLSGTVRLITLCLPLKWYANWLGKIVDKNSNNHIYDNPFIDKIRVAVKRSSKYVPWDTKCLVQAITAKKMFDRRRIHCILCLGIAKNKNGKMIAHAWTKCGNQVITGEKGMEKFTVVSTFR